MRYRACTHVTWVQCGHKCVSVATSLSFSFYSKASSLVSFASLTLTHTKVFSPYLASCSLGHHEYHGHEYHYVYQRVQVQNMVTGMMFPSVVGASNQQPLDPAIPSCKGDSVLCVLEFLDYSRKFSIYLIYLSTILKVFAVWLS